MCLDQSYCMSEYVQSVDGELCAMCRVSLTTRSGVGSTTGPWIMCEYDHEELWWNAWTACDFPVSLSQLGIPLSASHGIMEAVTNQLAVSPLVSIALDGGLLSVELLPATVVNPD